MILLLLLTMRKTIEQLLEELKSVDWRKKASELTDTMRPYAKKVGRAVAKPVLILYYVLTDAENTTADKALLYAALLYVLVPGDVLPRSVFKLLGVADDAAAILFVYNKVKDKVTPEILQKVEQTLDRWFGYRLDCPKEPMA